MASTATHPDASSLIPRVTEYARAYMANYDGSHDFNHIRRVVRLAQRIYASERALGTSDADHAVVTLCALLHDVGDKKYLREGESAESMVRDVLLGFGADPELAERVQAICLGVSYSSEIKDPAKVQRLIAVHPECKYPDPFIYIYRLLLFPTQLFMSGITPYSLRPSPTRTHAFSSST